MEIQHGNTYQRADINQQMEMLKQRHIIAVLKFRTKLYVGTRDQHGQEELLAYCFDNDNEMLEFTKWTRERYEDYKREAQQC